MAGLESEKRDLPPIKVSRDDKLPTFWPELPAASRYIRRNGWEHRSVPHELTKLPDGIVVPEVLQQIITWSLIPGSNWSYPAPKILTQESEATLPQNSLDAHKSSSQSSPATSSKVFTPTSSTDNVSNSSYKSSVTHVIPGQGSSSHENDRSLKNKLLAKIRLGKADERTGTATTRQTPQNAECTSCFEELPEAEMTRLKGCRHWYCKECLAALITTSMAAEATFPPKCCLTPMPLKEVLKALNATQREQYQEKAAEYAVPMADRWYCPDKDCLKWIPKSKLKINKDLGYNCPHCAVKLCRTCRGPAHAAGTECPQDFGLEATLETAEIEGWQRCYKCRALVEHNKGCRHMTCRCGAQFCYVCGLRWQTCGCTETDAANKRAGVESRRRAHTAKVDEEAEYIARAIAEVEEWERQEAEKREREALQRQIEEEEQLQWLETERLAEERRKREEAEQAERDFRRALVHSFEEDWKAIEALYYEIVALQSAEINSRHIAEDTRLSTMNVQVEADAKQNFDAVSLILGRNASRRRVRLTEQHKMELVNLETKQEEEEDDLFLQVQMRLRGKANKESRMERMLAEIHKQQEDDRKELEDRHRCELDELEQKITTDTTGLQRWYENKIQEARDQQTMALQKFGYTVGADRQYFDVVTARCSKMLERHGLNSLNSLEAGEEPTGLTEYEASQIQPFLPEFDDGEQGSSGITRGQSDEKIPTCHPSSMSSGRFYAQHTPTIRIEPSSTDDLYNSQQPALPQRSLSRPPIPGSFPIENTAPSYPPPPPPAPRFQPSPVRKPLSSPQSQPESHTNSHPHLAIPSVPSSPHNQRQYRDTPPLTTTQAITMASMAASMALSIAPPSSNPPVIPNESPSEQQRRPSNASSSSTVTLTNKKSRWGFRRREMSEEEFRRKMAGTVGDASHVASGGRLVGRLNVY